jgi:hypothetical protein
MNSYILRPQVDKMGDEIRDEFVTHGIHPICRNCHYGCIQYNAPGLIRLRCYAGDFVLKNGKLRRNVQNLQETTI